MRVIFLEDVPNVASAGEIKEVADGYARNFLIPKKLALLASSPDSAQLEAQRKAAQKKTDDKLTGLAHQLDKKRVTLKVKVGAKDRLYGAITSADIATKLEDATGLAIDKRKIELTEPIHQLGNYEVAIRLGKDVVPKIKVIVIAEEKEKAKGKAKTKEEKPTKTKTKTKPKTKAEKKKVEGKGKKKEKEEGKEIE